MSLTVGQIYGNDESREQALRQLIGFNIHVAIPAVVQSYDPSKQTIEAQPTIRERTITEKNEIQYVQYPLLINVPVMFPQVGNLIMTFPINQGDECLILFSDLSIDNWWLNGNVQNPVEQRRHDLSDGIAIFGLMNQKRLAARGTTANSDGMAIKNMQTGETIGVKSTGSAYFKAVGQFGLREASFTEVLDVINKMSIVWDKLFPESGGGT